MSASGHKTVHEQWNEVAQIVAQLTDDEVFKKTQRLYPEWPAQAQQAAAHEALFAADWVKSGRITYELTHSMAALLALTSAADISHLPHRAFAIKIPREFFPMEGAWPSADSWIAVGRRADIVAIFAIADSDTTATAITYYRGSISGDELETKEMGTSEEDRRTTTLARRFVANTIAYVLEHRDCTISRPQGKDTSEHKPTTYEVRPPREITIDREFRTAAKAAVSATSLVGIRRALRHVVRGHWRNQAVGVQWTERRRTWVRPHRRGDESLGSVVARVERMRRPNT